ncbi:MAG TPA: hypothetical protein VF198_03415 [Vicinamibacterales bacterium]
MYRSRHLVWMLALVTWLAAPRAARADWDLTLFAGRAFPIEDERLVLRLTPPGALPGVEIDRTNDPTLRPDGGLVFGAALAFEAGIVGIEGRVDATDVALDFTGARFGLRAVAPPFQGVAGTLDVGDGEFEIDRLYLLSLNLRLRTPGPIGLIASGGVSYLPDLTLSGSVPVQLQVEGLGSTPVLDAPLRLRAAPGESSHRFGVNGGAGIRAGAGPIAVLVEARVFYFRDYELRFESSGVPGVIDELLAGVDPVRFEPVVINAQAGVVVRF